MIDTRKRERKPRRGKADIQRVRDAIRTALEADWPMTVRQLFYRLVTLAVIAKTEGEYKQTVVRLTGEMRRAGEIPFGWIADNTRWQRKPTTHSSLEMMLERTAEAYRRSVWDDQVVYVEVWLEKDALAGVLYQVTGRWDVPLMVTQGYPSLSYLYDAAQTIQAHGKPAHLYYFGDHDPSGVDIPRKVEADIRGFAPDAEITFERVAVLPDQIAAMGLPTRPTKPTDTRSKRFAGESVEVDAIPPRTLREMTERCITRHLDRRAYRATIQAEELERGLIRDMARRYAEQYEDDGEDEDA